MLARGFAGHVPAPFSVRRAKLRPGISPRPFIVRELIHETPDAITLRLEDLAGEPVRFAPGQFFTLVLTVGGEELRRAYSASSPSHDTSGVCLTIKRVVDGRVSGYLNDQLSVGAVLKLLGPSGEFTADPESKHLVLIAGGSGVTPMRSIVRSLLDAQSTASRITLIHGNRAERDVIFGAEFAGLARDYPERFRYVPVFSEPPADFSGPRGLLDQAQLAQLLSEVDHSACHFMLCGPEGMLVEARQALKSLGVEGSRIREERFTQPHLRQRAVELPSSPQAVSLKLLNAGQAAEISFRVSPGRTLLEGALAAGAELPYSCTMGGCGRCKVKVTKGKVVMDEPNCLTAEEREQGFVLSCVGRPLEAVDAEVVA